MRTTIRNAEVEKGHHAADGDEQALLARVCAREVAAFEVLYRMYHARLARFLVRVTGRQQLAEEVINETMLVVWQKADSFLGESKLSTWIFAIAYRIGLKTLKRNEEPAEDKDDDLRASGEPGPEDHATHERRAALLSEAMMTLSADHRAVIELTYFHEMGYREISEIMECPVDTVKTRMFHARRHLRRSLSGSAPDWL